jgi:hypothetical protein
MDTDPDAGQCTASEGLIYAVCFGLTPAGVVGWEIFERNKMVDLRLHVMVIASAVSMLIASPGQAQRKALRERRGISTVVARWIHASVC